MMAPSGESFFWQRVKPGATCRKRRRQAGRTLLGSAFMLFALFLAGCNSSFYDVLGNKINVPQLALVPSTVTLKFTDTITFGAAGGVSPYLFTIVSGAGTLNPSTGAYTAPSSPGTTIIRVTDKRGAISDAAVTITPTAPLALTPPGTTINAGGTLAFVATGGTAPYTFSITVSGSAPPAPTINPITGVYKAGSALGVDTIRVTDSTSSIAAANVTVTNAVTNVDYTVTSAIFPTLGTGGTSIPVGPYTFALRNIGSANGTKTVSWWVFMSSSSTLGSGATVLESGTTAALGAGATSNVGVSWTWPAASGPMYLFVLVAADDDQNQSNNTYSVPSPVVLSPPDVDYTVSSVVGPGGTASQGFAINGSFTLNNVGTNNGSQAMNWSVFAFNTVDGSNTLVESGTAGALNAGSFSIINLNSSTDKWPLISGNYYLMVQISAADDVNPANNTGTSTSQTAVGLDATPTEPHNTTANAFNLGLTFRPGMSVSLGGTLSSSETDDIWEFNTGTANTITFTMVWAANQKVQFSAITSIPSFPTTLLGPLVNGTTLAWTWTPDGASAPRYLDIQNLMSANVGAYTLTISAN
jgi:hypothetical protein